jgi:HD-like signal output (HDOD) protein/ActR/RegA family two-component response regulator
MNDTDPKEKMRVLFVDDEPNILQGLKRMLRPLRHEWELAFAESGREALEIMTQKPFDIVISDMRMPVMSGLELLEQIKERYPHAVRIVLSGESDQGQIMESVRISHHFLTKPCNPTVLKSTISRACRLFDLLDSHVIRRVVSKMDSLPSMPDICSELTHELRSGDPSIQKICRIISKDAAMTAKVLHLVNSGFFCGIGGISNPAEAVVLLGLDTIKSLALSIGIFRQLEPDDVPEFFYKSLRDHSLITGQIAKSIAAKENQEQITIDQAFSAGMLHDVGKLVLASVFSEEYGEIITLTGEGDRSFCDCEIEFFGVTHAEVGAYLMGLWGLPVPILEAIAFHHAPKMCGGHNFSPLTAVHIADVMGAGERCSEKCDLPFDAEYISFLNVKDRYPVWANVCRNIFKGVTTVGE